MNAIIIIAGPTGSGKTAVAVELAKKINGEIISADSRQVYRYLDIGTNKEGTLDQKTGLRMAGGIAQRLTDVIEPSEIFSAGEFVKQAGESIRKIRNSKKLPIIAGGTGLYIKALVDGLAELPEQDAVIRAKLQAGLSSRGKEHLYERLKTIDPQAAEKNKGNPQRLIRALEVYELTGIPISALHKNTKPSSEKFIQFGLLWEREELYGRVDARSRKMLESGMIEETKRAVAMGFKEDCPGLQGLGYRRVIDFLKSITDRTELVSGLQQDNRNYAKRQITWFRKDNRINWIHTSEKQFSAVNIANRIADMVE
ncbi:MAG: tRNA (adenosine(37)-N6)-dimethylallyltransferase MiaA [Elusimicrobiota bacterium]